MITKEKSLIQKSTGKAIGPYVQAVADNGLYLFSGQLGFDVEHGSVIPRL